MTTYLDLSSKSYSDAEFEEIALLWHISKRNKSHWKSTYMKKRQSHGKFALTSEFSDAKFTNYSYLYPSFCTDQLENELNWGFCFWNNTEW